MIKMDLIDILNKFKIDILSSLNCIGIGVIEKYDKSTRRAQLGMAYKSRRPIINARGDDSDEPVDYPALVDCPVFTVSGGSSGLFIEPQKGDFAIILFNDVDMDNFISSKNIAVPDTGRLHSFSDAIALIGIENQIKSFEGGVALYSEQSSIHVAEKIEIKNQVESLMQIMNDLIIQIQAITVTSSAPSNPTSTPINAAAFTLINNRLKGLLK